MDIMCRFTVSEIFNVENIATLKTRSRVNKGHLNKCGTIR